MNTTDLLKLCDEVLELSVSEYDPVNCRLCGDKMSIARIGQGRIAFACTGRNQDLSWKEGRSIADEHYTFSRIERSLLDSSLPILASALKKLVPRIDELRQITAVPDVVSIVAEIDSALSEIEGKVSGG